MAVAGGVGVGVDEMQPKDDFKIVLVEQLADAKMKVELVKNRIYSKNALYRGLEVLKQLEKAERAVEKALITLRGLPL